ncbi:MAG: fumarate hydratase [Candidatus Bathyarchaeia archaeon]
MYGVFRLIDKALVTEVTVELLKRAAVRIPTSVKEALHRAWENEEDELARRQLETILENISLAEAKGVPVCQDTGLPIFYVKAGGSCHEACTVAEGIAEGTAKATKQVPLRENVIHPLSKLNPGLNVGWGMPFIYFEPSTKNFVEITVLLKGFGSEAKTSLAYIPTSEDVEKGIIKYVLDQVEKALGEPCPPYILGLGIGGTSDIAAALAKKAFMRLPPGKPNPDPEAAKLEDKLLKAVNETRVGPMGVGGRTTALAVHVELCGTHTAAVPVVLAFQCWADRQATVKITSEGKVSYS